MKAWIRVARCVSTFSPVAVLALAGAVAAQPVAVPDTWGGDVWSRPRLTGDWGGLRDELGKRGVVIDLDLLLTPQDVWSGARKNDAGFWGNAEYTLNVDTGKLGLWPGGFLKVSGQTSFGDTVIPDTGGLVPSNTAALVPEPAEDSTALMHATFTQFLSEKGGVTLGKFYTFDLFHGEFSGNYRTQFWNTGLAFPLAAGLVPISAYGGGVLVLPFENVVFSALALDPDGTPDEDDLGDIFEEGVTVVSSLQVKIAPWELPGHQTVGGTWSSDNRLSLTQDPTNIATALAQERFPWLLDPGPIVSRILERIAPALLVPAQPANVEDDTWAVFYAFDQYLWQPEGDPTSGIGVFFTFGASDGEANPVEYSFASGIGGKGVVPRRPHDSFGVGWARTEFSDDLAPLLRTTLDLGLDHEDAVEIYYNVAVTRWLNVTLDLQIIDSALEKKLATGPALESFDTAVVGGLSTYIRF